ncbi:transcriptional regulator with XRE-family HTH domain [Kribbella aluminosa]|uniref:Transcriptional regulator with XRE-family HTH domain n=1 Tax=Kribbella aluminosa TaxID=416017 RepID=A0ABS4UGP2_9ACTN|nr:DNA-binding protein [Kribbella aluminosa]MBP2350724.1 transcriptional regulator with XRE-family HTH domain [Kribbella aluminosa]
MEQSAQNLKQQVELYGEPLGEVVRRVTAALGLTQGGLAQVIGLSAPMLSQLVSAQRVKIGNPAVVSRLRAVSELADVTVADGLLPGRVAIELATIRSTRGAYTSATTNHHLRHPDSGSAGAPTTGAPTPFTSPAGLPVETSAAAWQAAPPDLPARAVVRELQDLFRSVASADEIQRAAAAAAAESPAVAELLLAYGTGRTADALAHYEQHHG